MPSRSNFRLPSIATAFSLICFAASAAHAQRATQNVRFSVTGATEASISPGGNPGSFGGRAPEGGPYPAPTSAEFNSTGSSNSSASLARGTVAKAASLNSNGSGSPAAVVSVPIWHAQFTVTNSEPNKKVTVSLDSPMPDGVDLTVELGASKSAVTAGMVVLGTHGTDAMTSIPTGSASVIPLGFGLATATATGALTRRVSFTLITGA